MPGPVSATDTLTSPFACVALTSTSPPAGVNFTAFESRLKMTCLIRRSSPVTTSRPPFACSVDLNAVRRCLFAHHRDTPLEGVLERERRDLQLHLAGFDLGQVEDVVDQGQQVVRRGEDVVEVLLPASR